MEKKFYFAPEEEVVMLDLQTAILAGSLDDPNGEGGDAPIDNTPHDASDF